MTNQDPIQQNKKLRVMIDQFQRYIKRLELNLREEKRKTSRLEVELFNLKRKMHQSNQRED